MATKVANSQAKAQAKAKPSLGTAKIVGDNLIITMPNQWKGEYCNQPKGETLPDAERSRRVGMVMEKFTLPNGEVLNLNCNLTLPPVVKVTQKERKNREIENLKRENAELKAMTRMVPAGEE